MIEFNWPKRSFIDGWFIDKKVCDDLVKFFNNTDQKGPGEVYYFGEQVVKKDRKDSIETSFDPEADIKEWSNYKTELQKVLNLYLKKYPEANDVAKFGLVEGANLQHYKPDSGYYSWHAERQGISDRHLVFMTYLNDVDEGGTEFKNQKIKLPARKGLTTIWPTDWTHTHRGVISKTQDKYIITGWFNYVKWKLFR